MSATPPRLGDDLEIYCQICRLNLYGTVSALQDGAIAKVQCRTCRHFQDFRPPVAEDAKRQRLLKKAFRLAEKHVSGRGGTASSKKTAHAVDLTPEGVTRTLWEEATRDASPMKMKPYDVHRTYRNDDMIAHKALGLGVVREVFDDIIVVLFRNGIERIEHSRERDEE
jgi:hypothetical protein